MEAAIKALEQALRNVKAAYGGGWRLVLDPEADDPEAADAFIYRRTDGYAPRYDAYLQTCADHNLVRLNAPNKVYSKSEIDYAVNTLRLDSGWYHKGGSGSGDDHAIRKSISSKVALPTGYE